MANKPSFVVATPMRSVCDHNARALFHHGLLRFLALGARRGTAGIPDELTRLKPSFEYIQIAGAMALSRFAGESFRFRLHPWFDRWVRRQMRPGDHIISSYTYANASFQYARQHGGKTFLDGGNSHPENFWSILSEEHKRWDCPYPPVARHFYERAVRMMPDVDYVLSPSSFVSRSFLERGFKPEQILKNVYPVDLSCFQPSKSPRSKDRPLTLIAPGSLSLRKGTPYLLEAFRLVIKKLPTARLILNSVVFDNVAPIIKKNSDLPITWIPALSAPKLAEQLRQSDILILPSLEEGLARTIIEGWACGLPVVITPNTGASDYVISGKNGEVVPIRDPQAIAQAVFKWAEVILSGTEREPIDFDKKTLSFEHFENEFIRQLRELKLAE